jgi:hypothetical protein
MEFGVWLSPKSQILKPIKNFQYFVVDGKKSYYNKSVSNMGPQRFRQVGERYSVIQVESESSLANQRLKKK